MSGAYYNEHDPYAAAWLRNLIAGGHIAPGDVDERSIVDVRADDLRGFAQCHFFAGIGGWSYALRLAGWPDDRPVWTGSCPCQPFSAAGKRRGVHDERHLWPEFRRLIEECGPTVVFGEQVASRDGRDWLAGVRNDLEALAYAVGAADLCAAGVGAPHIRQRLWWVADACRDERGPWRDGGTDGGSEAQPAGLRPVGGLADAGRERQPRQHALLRPEGAGWLSADLPETAGRSEAGRFGNADDEGSQERRVGPDQQYAPEGWEAAQRPVGLSGGNGVGRLEHTSGDGRVERRSEPVGRGTVSRRGNGFWDAFDLLPCTDGKARRVEPGTFPLAHGSPARVGRLRAYGNAIVPPLAAEFIKAFDGRPHDLPPHPIHRDRRP